MPINIVTELDLIRRRILRLKAWGLTDPGTCEALVAALDPRTVTVEQYFATGTTLACLPVCFACGTGAHKVVEFASLAASSGVHICLVCLAAAQACSLRCSYTEPDPEASEPFRRACLLVDQERRTLCEQPNE